MIKITNSQLVQVIPDLAIEKMSSKEMVTKIFKSIDKINPISFDIIKKSDFYDYCGRKLFYELVNMDGVKLGDVLLHEWKCICSDEEYDNKKHLYIDSMNSHVKGSHLNVGRAIHEFVFKLSDKMGYQKKVRLIADNGSDGFHFKCFFRYESCHISTLTTIKIDELIGQSLNQCYFDLMRKKKNNQPVTEVEKQFENSLSKTYYLQQLQISHIITECAKAELGRDPVNLAEKIEFGLYFDPNKILDRVYFHPEEITPERKKSVPFIPKKNSVLAAL